MALFWILKTPVRPVGSSPFLCFFLGLCRSSFAPHPVSNVSLAHQVRWWHAGCHTCAYRTSIARGAPQGRSQTTNQSKKGVTEMMRQRWYPTASNIQNQSNIITCSCDKTLAVKWHIKESGQSITIILAVLSKVLLGQCVCPVASLYAWVFQECILFLMAWAYVILTSKWKIIFCQHADKHNFSSMNSGFFLWSCALTRDNAGCGETNHKATAIMYAKRKSYSVSFGSFL